MFCPKCGKEIIEGTRFCTKCGTPFTFIEAGSTDEERATARETDVSEDSWDSGEYYTSDLKRSVMPYIIAGLAIIVIAIIAVGVYYITSHDKKSGSETDASVAYDTLETEAEADAVTHDQTDVNEPETVAQDAGESDDTQIAPASDDTQAEEDIEHDEIPDAEYDVLEDLDIEAEVLRIREIYNTIQNDCGGYDITEHDWGTMYDGGQYKKLIVKSGYNGNDLERWYFYEGDRLIFSFYYSESNEQRFYFYDNKLFRWKDNDVTYDKGYDVSGWYDWEQNIIDEGRGLLR